LRLNLSRWVFKPPDERLPEENERWWNECYLPQAVEDILENRSQWCVLAGGYQGGKSTALAALARNMEGRALLIHDDFLFRPEQEKPQGNILQRVLRSASRTLRQDLVKDPGKFSLLSPTQMEFLRWSVEKFHGRRAFLRWLDGLPQDISQSLQAIEFEDLYPSPTSDVGGQVEELVNLGAKFGCQQVLTIVDCPPLPNHDQIEEIEGMLSWLEPMQDIRLKAVIALPPSIPAQKIRELSRGRVSILKLESTPDHAAKVVSRHLSAATEGSVQKAEQIFTPKLTAQLREFVQGEFGSAVGAWLKIVEIALERINEIEKTTLGIEALPDIKRAFYERFMLLRLGPEGGELGCWRGRKWIPLDRAVYDFLTVLIHHKGKRINHEMAHTTKGNLHTLAKRLRAAIEPDGGRSIYIKNIKGEGYWLEHFIT